MNIIMKGRVSSIKMNFNKLFNIINGVYYFNELFHMNIITRRNMTLWVGRDLM